MSAHAVKGERIGWQPVAAGAADLLVIAFDIGRHIGVQHEADIGLVDAHAERDRRHHDDAVLLQEDILVARSGRRLHAGVIGQRLDAGVAQEFRQFLGLAPRAAINDAALPPMRHDEIGDLLAAAGFCRHRQPQVGPIEAVDKHSGLTRKQPGQNVGARGGIGGRGESHGLHAAELRLHLAKPRIFRTEIMAPLRDAMRLVDGQELDLGALEQIERVRPHQPLRRDIDEAQFAAHQAIEHRAVFVRIVGGIERRGGNTIAAQLRDLIAHERDQRRHHNGKALAAEQRRKLVTQRLAAPGRHHRQHIAAFEDRGHDLGLPGPEGLEAKGLAEHTFRRRDGWTISTHFGVLFLFFKKSKISRLFLGTGDRSWRKIVGRTGRKK